MSDKKQQKLDEKEHKEQDDYLEEALEETFPASDPISPGHVSKKLKTRSRPARPKGPASSTNGGRKWYGWGVSNLRPQVPQTCALTN